MKRNLLAACLAGVALAVAGPGGRPVELRAEDAEPGDAMSLLTDGLPMPTLGGMQFWADEIFFHQWRIQRNVIDGHCRLLDGNYVRHASGTYEHCLAKLEEVKHKLRLPPMRGKAVIVLHGLGRTRTSMTLLCKYLQFQGKYTVFNVGYPSTRLGIADHARTLAKIVENLQGVEEINFVAHSMGNIVIRHYLADQTDERTGRRPDPRIKRFVMLGPPNHGSVVAAEFADNPLVTTVLGEPGQELGRRWVWLESDLATPHCEFGIVAGGRNNDQGYSPMLPGDDDGIVTVDSARLAGAGDFVVVPVLHTLLSVDPRVLKYTLSFLQNGYFISAEKRRPVAGN